MKRIAIIGPSGAGKTALAKKLAIMLGIKACHLDRLFWQRGWKGETGETRIDILQNFLLLRNEWIIEGTYLRSSGPRLEAADTIIFLDTFPLLCLLRIILRYIKCRQCVHRRDIPEGCKDKLTPYRMLKVLAFPIWEHRRLERLLNNYQSKDIIRLKSRKQVEAFLANQKNAINPVASVKESTSIGVSDACTHIIKSVDDGERKVTPFTPSPTNLYPILGSLRMKRRLAGVSIFLRRRLM